MAFPNITEFKEKMLDGGARPSLFRMEINWPAAIAAGNALGGPLVPFHCRLAEIPGNNINFIPFKYAGREIKFAAQRTFTNLGVTIINDEGFRVRRALETWFEQMNTRETNVMPLTSPTGEPSRGYSGVGRVVQYGKTGNIARSYVFVDMFPVTIEPIPLDWSNDAAIEDYRVEFAYQYWVPGEEYAGQSVTQFAV